LPALVDYRDTIAQIDHVRDQGGTNSCVAFAMCRAAHTTAHLLGTPMREYPSALLIYAIARLYGGVPGQPLVDFGSYPSAAEEAVKRWGFCPERLWPFVDDGQRVNRLPDLYAMHQAADHVLTGTYEVFEEGGSRLTAIAQQLAQRHIVTCAVEVDKAFEQANGVEPIDAPSGPSLGKHAICLCGYRRAETGEFDFLVCNSWGIGWGNGGFGWINANRVMHESTESILVVTSAPRA
jgi:hypothetical protein